MMDIQKKSTAPYSVLMTVYAKEDPAHFEQAIRSMLLQTVKPDEFVIVCDGPLTDSLEAVIAFYSAQEPGLFHIVRCAENGGSGTASRIGLAECRNEFVARMDSDDIAVANRMELSLKAMEEDPGLAVVGGQMAEFIREPGQIVGYRILPTEPEEIYQFTRARSPMNNITVLMRKSAVLDVGSYSDLRIREDYELWIRLLAKGYRLRNVNYVLAYARVGEKMYDRRRGMEYSKYAVHTEKLLLELGWISKWRSWRNLAIRFTMSVILPRKLSHWIFRTFLRKRRMCQEIQECGDIPVEVFTGPFQRAAGG